MIGYPTFVRSGGHAGFAQHVLDTLTVTFDQRATDVRRQLAHARRPRRQPSANPHDQVVTVLLEQNRGRSAPISSCVASTMASGSCRGSRTPLTGRLRRQGGRWCVSHIPFHLTRRTEKPP
jgi:hypothetical protein